MILAGLRLNMKPKTIFDNVLNKLSSISVSSLTKAIITAYGGKQLYSLWQSNPDTAFSDLNTFKPIVNYDLGSNYTVQQYVDSFFEGTTGPYTASTAVSRNSASGTQYSTERVRMSDNTTFGRVVDTIRGKVVKEYAFDDAGRIVFTWQYTLADYLTILD